MQIMQTVLGYKLTPRLYFNSVDFKAFLCSFKRPSLHESKVFTKNVFLLNLEAGVIFT